MRIVIDTHALFWLVSADGALSTQACAAIAQAADTNEVLIPAIVIWELAMLHERGRISLSQPLKDWISTILAMRGFGLAPLSPEIAIESCSLPGRFGSGDPADRLIAATARILKATLVTRDRRLLEYADQGFVTAIRA